MSEVVDTPETPAAEQAADNSTSTEHVLPPTQTDPPAETPPPAPEIEAAKTPLPVDKARQERDQAKARERAEREKTRDDEVAKLKSQVDQLLKGIATPQTPKVEAEADDISKMADEALRLEEESERVLSEDHFDADKIKAASQLRAKAGKLRTDAIKAADAANRQQVEHGRQLAEQLRQRDAKDADAQATTTFWKKWAQEPANAGIPVDKAQALNAECYQKAAAAGYEGKALSIRQTELFNEQLATLKTNSPATTPSPKTATATSVSAPVATQVIPATTGARKDATQLAEVAKRIGVHFRKKP